MPHQTGEGERLDVRASLDDLGRVRDFVAAGAGAAGLSPERVGELVLAVDEAVSNIVLHGGAPASAGIEVRLARTDDAVQVRIRDPGRPFDPRRPEGPTASVSPLDREQPGGYGLALMNRLVDRIGYRLDEGGCNELVLAKRLQPVTPAGRA